MRLQILDEAEKDLIDGFAFYESEKGTSYPLAALLVRTARNSLAMASPT